MIIINTALAEKFRQDFENDIELEYLIHSHIARANHKETTINLFDDLQKAGAGYFVTESLTAKSRVMKSELSLNLYNIRNRIKNKSYEYDTTAYYVQRDLAFEATIIEISIDTLRTATHLLKIFEQTKQVLLDDLDIEMPCANFLELDKDGLRSLITSLEIDYQKSDPDCPLVPLTQRQLRAQQRYLKAAIEQRLRLVGRFGAERATKRCVRDRVEMNNNNQHFLDTHEVISGCGKKLKLADVALTRDKRLNEIYCIAGGIEKLGKSMGMRWARVVCTLPSHLHTNSKYWDGSLPNESIKYIREAGERMRASLAKQKVTLSGFWTVEAHKDGAPHINFLVWFDQSKEYFVERAFNTYFKHSDRAINWQIGTTSADSSSFASYALKYFTKTFNTSNVDQKYKDAAMQEEAWASAFRIRRYGFLGVPSLGLWRKLRASKEKPADEDTEAIWRAARGNRASEFIALSGGLGIKAKLRKFKTVSVQNKKSRVTVGVRNVKNGYELIVKRVGEWTIKKIIEAVEEVKKTITNNVVTLKTSYPRSALSRCADELTHAFFSVTSTPPPEILTS